LRPTFTDIQSRIKSMLFTFSASPKLLLDPKELATVAEDVREYQVLQHQWLHPATADNPPLANIPLNYDDSKVKMRSDVLQV